LTARGASPPGFGAHKNQLIFAPRPPPPMYHTQHQLALWGVYTAVCSAPNYYHH